MDTLDKLVSPVSLDIETKHTPDELEDLCGVCIDGYLDWPDINDRVLNAKCGCCGIRKLCNKCSKAKDYVFYDDCNEFQPKCDECGVVVCRDCLIVCQDCIDDTPDTVVVRCSKCAAGKVKNITCEHNHVWSTCNKPHLYQVSIYKEMQCGECRSTMIASNRW
jgi:hypothetical protein